MELFIYNVLQEVKVHMFNFYNHIIENSKFDSFEKLPNNYPFLYA